MKVAQFEYLWVDDIYEKTADPTAVCAPEYITRALACVGRAIVDEKLFPIKDEKFPPEFDAIVRQVFRHLLRVYSHVYYSHFDRGKWLSLRFFGTFMPERLSS